MTILFENLTKIYNGKIIFENISGRVNKGDKVGIIGKNGIGKTTLIKIIMGFEERDGGDISFSPEGIGFSYLTQNADFNEASTVYEEISKIKNIKSSLNSSKYGSILKKRIREIGFDESYYNIPVSRLSGGEKTRLSILKMLLEDSEILVFDEPTNHLDMETIKWLEEFLMKIDKTIIIISHDRLFLDNTVNKIFEMERNLLKEYRGNYTSYREQREIEIKNQQTSYEKQEREINHLKKVINERKNWYESAHKAAGQNDFLRSKSKKHVNVLRTKEKMLQRIEDNRIEKPRSEMAAAFNIINGQKQEKRLPEYLIRAKGIDKSYGKKRVLQEVSFSVKRGNRIALIGKNGSGKTTLFKLITGQEKRDKGEIYINPLAKIGYFSQELEGLDLNSSILEEMLKSGEQPQNIRLLLGCLLFRGEDVHKKIENLSMGEKCRAAFAKLILSNPDIIMLDEPTNYMDIISREKIEEALENYNGTLILVSHDRYFIKKIADRIFEIHDSKLEIYEGDFEYFMEKKAHNEIAQEITDYSKIKNEISRLECEIAFIFGKLDDLKISPDEKQDLNTRFITISKKLHELKSSIGL